MVVEHAAEGLFGEVEDVAHAELREGRVGEARVPVVVVDEPVFGVGLQDETRADRATDERGLRGDVTERAGVTAAGEGLVDLVEDAVADVLSASDHVALVLVVHVVDRHREPDVVAGDRRRALVDEVGGLVGDELHAPRRLRGLVGVEEQVHEVPELLTQVPGSPEAFAEFVLLEDGRLGRWCSHEGKIHSRTDSSNVASGGRQRPCGPRTTRRSAAAGRSSTRGRGRPSLRERHALACGRRGFPSAGARSSWPTG
mgnify:CR=1 FL=1